MRAGSRRSLITVRRQVQMGRDARNQPRMVWQDWRPEIFAELVVLRGKEHYDASTKQRISEEVYRFMTPYEVLEGVDTTMVVVDSDGAVYDIKAILPDKQARRSIVLECTLQNAIAGAAPLSGYLDDLPAPCVHGVAYAGCTVLARGGTAPYSFAVTAGALPNGLVLGAETGVISGTATAAGTSSGIVVTVTDAAGDTHDMPPFDLVVT